MEGPCDLKWSLPLVLVLILASFFFFDSYHVNQFLSFISPQSQTNWNYGLPSLGRPSSGSVHAGLQDHESQYAAASPLVESAAAISRNKSSVNEGIQKQQKKKRHGIQKVETGLRHARAAIRKAIQEQKQEPMGSHVPTGEIYRNAHAFHRSYSEMEKRFKIFVYREGELPLVHDGPCRSIYMTEGRFIQEIELGNRFVTSNPEDAHVYFLPFSIYMMVKYIYVPNTYDVTPLRRVVRDYIDVVSNKYPFWNRSLGGDHFMLSCHDWGPIASEANPFLYNNSIRVLCNANTSEGFNPRKDAALPEMNLRNGLMGGLSDGLSALERPILAFFAGGNHGSVRPTLFKHWKDKNDEDIHVYEYLPSNMSYIHFLKRSRYCLCPSGYEVASPRIVEAIYSECVPVIISVDYVLPFSDVLNWTSFSVQIPLSEVPNLKTILQSIPVNRYIQMQRGVKQVQKHFSINQPLESYDMFHMILHSIWLRRLNIQISS
eukprot:PITA_09943